MLQFKKESEPIVKLQINGEERELLIDTGATASCLTGKGSKPLPMSNSYLRTVGFSGKTETQHYTVPLETVIGKQTVKHQYLKAPKCPVNLMGRDLLIKLGAEIVCTCDGIRVKFGGKTTTTYRHGEKILLMQETNESSQLTTVYWNRLKHEEHEGGLQHTYQKWKQWIKQQGDYEDLKDPLHMTYKYTEEKDEIYDEGWEEAMEGMQEKIKARDVYLGKEGVAAYAELNAQQEKWVSNGKMGLPHITLLVGTGYKAKQLGPMIKRALQIKEWRPTKCRDLHVTEDGTMYRISHTSENEGITREKRYKEPNLNKKRITPWQGK